jgi:dienelactone hydrolase
MLTRRCFLALAAASPGWSEPAGDGRMLWTYFLGKLGAADTERRRKLRQVNTRAELSTLRTRVRTAMREMIGAFPPRTPLNARKVGELERTDYVIEKIIFESRPKFYVTANLYRPKSTESRRPALIHSCGHYETAKAAPDYQRVCIGLAKKGFIALSYDPLGQGERLQYLDEAGRPLVGKGTSEHAMAGKAAYLTGRTLAHYRIWDGIRALDYLESRPDVDGTHLGMVGQSGGGMLTLLTAPLDDRLQAAMSACAVTSYYHKTRALLTADPEQIQPGVYARGIDHPELIAAVAPRAFLIGSAARDYVPLEGARRTYEEAKPLFRLAGAAENLGMVVTDDQHKFNKELREACYSWMQKHLAGAPGDAREPDFEIEKEEDLRCTPAGRVRDLPGAKTVFDLTREYARELEAARPPLTRDRLRSLLALPAKGDVPRLKGSGAESRLVRVSGSGPAVLLLVAEQGVESPAVQALSHEFQTAGRAVAAADLRGWGRIRPDIPELKARFAWEDFFTYRSFELGRPLLGMRVFDLLQTARMLRGRFRRVYAVGIEGAGLVALHAAAADDVIDGVATVRTLISYRNVLETPIYTEPVSSFLPSAFASYDLPQLAGLVRPRPLVAIEPRDARRRPLGAAVPEEDIVRAILSGFRS